MTCDITTKTKTIQKQKKNGKKRKCRKKRNEKSVNRGKFFV